MNFEWMFEIDAGYSDQPTDLSAFGQDANGPMGLHLRQPFLPPARIEDSPLS